MTPLPKPEPPRRSTVRRPRVSGSYRSRRAAGAVRAASTATRSTLSPRAVDRATPRGPTVLRLKVVRSWISRSGPKAQRQTTFVFHLSRAGIVELVLTRLAPDCRVVGKFRVAGRAGLNRVRFRGRIGRRVLRPGTYRVTARTLRPRGATPVRVHLVIVGKPNPLPGELAAARAANACVASTSESRRPSAAPSLLHLPRVGTPSRPSSASAACWARSSRKRSRSSRGCPRTCSSCSGWRSPCSRWRRFPAGAAPTLRIHKFLAYHRELVALAGTVTLIAAAISYVVW